MPTCDVSNISLSSNWANRCCTPCGQGRATESLSRLSTIAESGSSLSSSSRTSLSTCPNTGHANNINNKVKRYFLVSPIKLYIFIIIFSHPFHQLSAEPILVLRLHGHHAVGPIHDHHKAAQPSQAAHGRHFHDFRQSNSLPTAQSTLVNDEHLLTILLCQNISCMDHSLSHQHDDKRHQKT